MVPDPPIDEEGAKRIMRTFIVPEDLHTPPGAVTLRGSTNFKTPPGWDSVYLPVLNMIERPVAPMLVVRVETDWYPHESEFRYVLQPGQVIPGSHSMPIGQCCSSRARSLVCARPRKRRSRHSRANGRSS